MNTAQLPERTQRFLDHGAPEGRRQAEAFAAAVQLRDAGFSEGEATRLVEGGAARCGLPPVEARGAVKSAYKHAPREPIGKGHGTSGGNGATKKEIVATYDYIDGAGNLLHQTIRYLPKGFKQRRPDGKGGWIWTLDGITPVLYSLPEILKATGKIWLVEGEKDADALRALGFTATTNPMGAKNWRAEYTETLRGKSVIICGDNDAAGREHVAKVSRALHGVAASVKIVTLVPEAGGVSVKDVSDYIATFPDKADAAERFSVMAESAAFWTPETAPEPGPETARTLDRFALGTEAASRTLAGDRWLSRGGSVLLCGPTGVGKSSFVMQLGIDYALGRPFFGIAPSGKLSVLIVQAENDDPDIAETRDGIFDGLALTEAQRAEACQRIKVVCETTRTGADFVALLSELAETHKPDLIVVDPLFAFLGDSVCEQKAVSTFLRNGVNAVLKRHSAGLVLVHHVNKPRSGKDKPDWQAGDFAYLGAGTAELANWARAVVVIRSVGSHSVFEIVLGKRGRRAGLCDGEGNALYSFHAKHAAKGIHWEPAGEDDLPVDGDSRCAVTVKDVAAEFDGGQVHNYAKLVEILVEKHGVSSRTAKRAVVRAAGDKTITRTSSGLYELCRKVGDR
jgi:5S rRNA maturation endonuclease (ribonuclease M5)